MSMQAGYPFCCTASLAIPALLARNTQLQTEISAADIGVQHLQNQLDLLTTATSYQGGMKLLDQIQQLNIQVSREAEYHAMTRVKVKIESKEQKIRNLKHELQKANEAKEVVEKYSRHLKKSMLELQEISQRERNAAWAKRLLWEWTTSRSHLVKRIDELAHNLADVEQECDGLRRFEKKVKKIRRRDLYGPHSGIPLDAIPELTFTT